MTTKWLIEFVVDGPCLYVAEGGPPCGNVNHAMKWNSREGAEAYAKSLSLSVRIVEHAWCDT